MVSWNTEGSGNIGKYNRVVPEDSVCISPLNWKTDDTYASADENNGCLVKNDDGSLTVVKGFADAKIDEERGSVIVTSADLEEYAMLCGSGIRLQSNEVFDRSGFDPWLWS